MRHAFDAGLDASAAMIDHARRRYRARRRVLAPGGRVLMLTLRLPDQCEAAPVLTQASRTRGRVGIRGDAGKAAGIATNTYAVG